MSSTATASMIINRVFQRVTGWDAAGHRLTEDEDYEVEVELTGEDWEPAEPDIGIFQGGFGTIFANDKDGNEVELTKKEEAAAQELLSNARYDDAAEYRAEQRRSRSYDL